MRGLGGWMARWLDGYSVRQGLLTAAGAGSVGDLRPTEGAGWLDGYSVRQGLLTAAGVGSVGDLRPTERVACPWGSPTKVGVQRANHGAS